MNEKFMKEKPVFPLIMSMATPMVISMLVNSLYNIVDSFFVAKIGEDAITALSLVYPVQNLVNALAIGFGVGLNAVVAFHLGAGEKEAADTAATHGFLFSILHGIIAAAVSIPIMRPFLKMFTQSENVISLGVRYSTIVFSFSIVIMISLAYEKIFQAVGRMNASMAGLMTGCIVNIILDPLLIFGIGPFPKMGIDGAALATGIGQVSTLLLYVVLYAVKKPSVTINRKYLKRNKAIDRKLYFVGIPAAINLALPSLLVSSLNAMLASFSQIYVVVLGVYYKLQTFLYLPANGIVQGMRPIIGYNYGAAEHKRVKKIYDITLVLTAGIMLFGTVLCLALPHKLIGMFTDNPETIDAGKKALRIISAGFVVSSISVTSSGALEGLGKGVESLIISLCRYAVIIIPTAFVLTRIFGADGVWNAFWIAEAVSAVISAVVYKKAVGNKLNSRRAENNF